MVEKALARLCCIKEYFQELAQFNGKWLEKCSIEICQTPQPKHVAVETNLEHDLIVRGRLCEN